MCVCVHVYSLKSAFCWNLVESEKCKSTSPGETQMKRQQKAISTWEKSHVIDQSGKVNVLLISAMFFTWPRVQYEKCVIMQKKVLSSIVTLSYSRSLTMQYMEKIFSMWSEDQKQCYIPYLFLIISNICVYSIWGGYFGMKSP